ncbi:MAG TPA: LysR family transcriptional regulator [Acidimicrobiales bacterium]
MELRHLRYFIAVAEELHFGRAARRLRITQPPLSLQIQSLERELGVQLLVRGRRVQLTEAGRALLHKAREAIEAADAAARAAQQASLMINGRLRVGYPAAGVFELPPLALRTFQERYPNVGVETVVATTGAHLEALRTRQLDVAFVRLGVLDRETMRFRALQPEPLVLAVPEGHALAQLPVVPVGRLAGEPIILFPYALEPLLYRYLVTDVLGRSRVAPSVVLEATTLESACSAVAARLGVAFVGEPLTRIFAIPGVAYRPFAPPPPLSELGVAWRQDATSNAIRWFLEVLDELAEAAGPNRRLRSSVAGNGRRSPASVLVDRPSLQVTANGGIAT